MYQYYKFKYISVMYENMINTKYVINALFYERQKIKKKAKIYN